MFNAMENSRYIEIPNLPLIELKMFILWYHSRRGLGRDSNATIILGFLHREVYFDKLQMFESSHFTPYVILRPLQSPFYMELLLT